MKPIIKWPGGKTREVEKISTFLPDFQVLVEPFAGGCALFFALEPESAYLNDASRDLVEFYRAVQAGDGDLRALLDDLAADRREVSERATRRTAGFAEAVATARTSGEWERAGALARGVGDADFRIHPSLAEEELSKYVIMKIGRILGLEAKHDKVFDPEELAPQFETALQAGYYTAVRDRWEPEEPADRLARFFFLRELCYGSMFRYSKKGRFNIPYGGISYNRLSFAKKVERIFSTSVRGLLERARFSRRDFEEHLVVIRDRLGDDCFVFLDPPYDTEFSAYEDRGFGREEHERLARVFADLPCPALLVIQSTKFIRELYERVRRSRSERDEPFFLVRYDKRYGYNVRGRNVRDARHLLVGNYKPPRGGKRWKRS